MNDEKSRMIERVYMGPWPDDWRAMVWFACIGIWTGFLAQLWVIAHPSAWSTR